MASMTEVEVIVNNLLFDAVHLDAPSWFLHPMFMVLFGERTTYDELCAAYPLEFAPGLLEVLSSSSSPPPFSYFKSLPSNQIIGRARTVSKLWAVYVHCLEMEGRKPLLYTGSGTSEHGAGTRLVMYENHHHSMLPRYVKRAFDQGYVKTHSALLCWSPIPTAAMFPKCRQRYLGIEGVFQMLFFSAIPSLMDPLWSHLVPWARSNVEWGPLCSHISLRECAEGDFNAAPEELERIVIERKARVNTRQRQYKQLHYAKHQVMIRESRRKHGMKTKAAHTFECKICDGAFTNEFGLRSHLKSKTHLKKVELLATGIVPERSKDAIRIAETVAKNKASKKHHCQLCNQAFGVEGMLKRHYKTKKHIAKAALTNWVPEEKPIAIVDSSKLATRIQSAKSVAKLKALKKYWCKLCDRSFGARLHLERHYTTQRHQQAAALADAEIYAADFDATEAESDASLDADLGAMDPDSDLG